MAVSNPLSAQNVLHMRQLTTDLSPSPVTILGTIIFILCLIIIASCLFIELVAYFTKKAVNRVAAFLASHLTCPPQPLIPYPQPNTPRVLIHQLIDRICPITTHTPTELPVATSPPSILPPTIRSPCFLCDLGIAMGELCRHLPCGHTFHARCIDKVWLTFSNHSTDLKRCVTCCACNYIIYPTPDPMRDVVIIVGSPSRCTAQ